MQEFRRSTHLRPEPSLEKRRGVALDRVGVNRLATTVTADDEAEVDA